jgi:hypothetical protein
MNKEFEDSNILLSQKFPSTPNAIRNRLQKIDKTFSGTERQGNARQETARLKKSEELSKDIAALKKSVEKNKKLMQEKK